MKIRVLNNYNFIFLDERLVPMTKKSIHFTDRDIDTFRLEDIPNNTLQIKIVKSNITQGFRTNLYDGSTEALDVIIISNDIYALANNFEEKVNHIKEDSIEEAYERVREYLGIKQAQVLTLAK